MGGLIRLYYTVESEEMIPSTPEPLPATPQNESAALSQQTIMQATGVVVWVVFINK